MLQEGDLSRAIATNMDAGLASVDRETRTLRYAGAKISLYWSDGQQVGEIKGGRRAILVIGVKESTPMKLSCTLV